MNKLRLLRNILLIIISGVVLFILSDWMLTASDRYRVYPVDMNDTLGTRGVYIGGIDNTKPSVIVMGCSFAFGVDLKDFETLPDKIQKFTGRKTLNFAFPAHSIQHVLYKIHPALFHPFSKSTILISVQTYYKWPDGRYKNG